MRRWWRETSGNCVVLQQRTIAYAAQWEEAFEPLWEQCGKENDLTAFVHASMLEMHVESVGCSGRVCMEEEENFDGCNSLFADIVNIAEYSLQVLNSNSSTSLKFQFGSHVVISLYIRGYKCREPKTRKRAIPLLLTYRGEERVFLIACLLER
jgi:hypothetical protein